MRWQAGLVAVAFTAGALWLARIGRRLWRGGDETGALVAAAASSGLTGLAIFCLALGA
ncbi:hypothetical protein ACLQ2R_03330 [Streptosporangium sp. DT93]|uniref:hypothetical protein n=1 Tax=Streptosporangium sp. DT93 TaxID=3393428 RepID=UPI003CF7FD4C